MWDRNGPGVPVVSGNISRFDSMFYGKRGLGHNGCKNARGRPTLSSDISKSETAVSNATSSCFRIKVTHDAGEQLMLDTAAIRSVFDHLKVPAKD